MKSSLTAIALVLSSILAFHHLSADDSRNADGIDEKIQRLARKWYGDGAKITAVKEWTAVRISAQGYGTDGEKRWLVLLPEKPIGIYNACVVPMMIDSERNRFCKMSEEAKNALLAISKRTVVSGVSTDKKLNDLVTPYLLRTVGEKSREWTLGTYHYHPVEKVREYQLDLRSKSPKADAIATDASIYVDRNDFLIHRKVTGVLTISRGGVRQ